MALARKTIPGSERTAPASTPIGLPDPQERAEVSIYLKRPPAQAPTTRAELRKVREEEIAPAIDHLTAFAHAHGLEVGEHNPARRLVKVSGLIQALEAAFGTKLHSYEGANGTFRGRSGALSVPRAASAFSDSEWIPGRGEQ